MAMNLNIKADKMREKGKALVDETKFREARGTSDTVKVWENYREQAMLWRALALLQIPATFIALVFAMIIWVDSEVKFVLPEKPLPGFYNANEIRDVEFESIATEFLNLVATYQPGNAEKQFRKATEYMAEPILGKFQQEIIGNELKAIVSTRRSQTFFADPTLTEITRLLNNRVKVNLKGERSKWVAGEALPVEQFEYTLILTTIPRNVLNQYGIVVENYSLKKIVY